MSFLSDIGIGGLIGAGIGFFLGGPAGAGAGAGLFGTSAATTGAILGATMGVSAGAQKHSADLTEEQIELGKQQAAIRSKMAGLRASRERAEILRRSRIARGAIEARAGTMGTLDASSVIGATGGITSRTAGSVGFSNVASGAGEKLFGLGMANLSLEKEKGTADLVAGGASTLFGIGLSSARGEFNLGGKTQIG